MSSKFEIGQYFMSEKTDFQQEWAILHQSVDQYESYALLLKVIGITLFFVSLLIDAPIVWLISVFLVLWLQEAIWKTFQSRTEERLLMIEKAMKSDEASFAFVFYSQWESQRPKTLGLMKAYLVQALRPTIAYPYAVLVMLSLLSSVNF